MPRLGGKPVGSEKRSLYSLSKGCREAGCASCCRFKQLHSDPSWAEWSEERSCSMHRWTPCAIVWGSWVPWMSLTVGPCSPLSTCLLPCQQNSICSVRKFHWMVPSWLSHWTPNTMSQLPKGISKTSEVNSTPCNLQVKCGQENLHFNLLPSATVIGYEWITSSLQPSFWAKLWLTKLWVLPVSIKIWIAFFPT